MNTLAQLLDELLRREGGYVNNPADKGGPTKFGITEAVARASGYRGDMRDYPLDDAKELYLRQYWRRPGFDKVSGISYRVATELFDTGVNMGPKVAIEFLQRALNGLNRNGKDYADIDVDGQLGESTLAALDRYFAVRSKTMGEDVLLVALNVLQGARYIDLAESRPANENFLFGWLRERVNLV